jgi:hypothetical protein
MDKKEYIKQKNILFEEWQQSGEHKGVKPFNKDGVIDPNIWYSQDLRVLFLLKEAYHKEEYETYDLAEKLCENGPWDSMWRRVAEWGYGLRNTTAERIADYNGIYGASTKSLKEELRRIAIVNVKKSNGKSESSWKDIQNYADADKDFLNRQIDLIDPTVIVCGYTFAHLNDFYCEASINKKDKNQYNPDGFYKYKNIMILDYYHPSDISPAFMTFYALCAIWQNALIKKSDNTRY